MAAIDMGIRRGREYLQRYSVEQLANITLQEFCAIGRLDARQHYKIKKAQDDYALGWWNVGKQFLTLFKPDDKEQFVAEKEIEDIRRLLNNAEQKIKKLLQLRQEDVSLNFYLDHALGGVEEAGCNIEDAASYLKRSQMRGK